jgi:hypothetical protein
MMISEPAMMCLHATWQRLIGKSTRSTAGADERLHELEPSELAQGVVDERAELLLIATALDEGERVAEARDQKPALPARADVSMPLAANERRARAAALRGMVMGRERRFDAARTAFAEAAGLDPVLDLTRTPAFWTLERAAHEAAIDAYAQVGRERDAAVLRARVHSTFRPKPLRPHQQVILHP